MTDLHRRRLLWTLGAGLVAAPAYALAEGGVEYGAMPNAKPKPKAKPKAKAAAKPATGPAADGHATDGHAAEPPIPLDRSRRRWCIVGRGPEIGAAARAS